MDIIKVVTRLEKSRNNTHYIPIPEEIASPILDTFGKRVLCMVNGHAKLHCAIMKHRDIGYYITVGKATKAKIKANHGDELCLEITKDESEYQAELPEELKEVLLTDEEGLHRFENLTPGKKRSIIHYVNSAKQMDTRINRALKILENLKMGMTDLKELMR